MSKFSVQIIPYSREPVLNNNNLRVLRLNVGFMLKEGIGYHREFAFDEPEIQVAEDFTILSLRGTVTLTRTPQGLYAQGRLQAILPTECDRCLDPITQSVSSRIAELFIYPPEEAPEGAPTVGDDFHLDLAPLMREDMWLSVPLQKVCRPDCKGLCPNCGQNWNEGPCECADNSGDPRFEVLKQLLKK